MHQSSDYRPDIDGLRAVAVLSVVLFHYDFGRFAGGFVGVDVFFVISGFLITRLIVAQLKADRFSFAQFYLRRARRLLPALFVTLAASLCAGALLFTPEHLALLAQSTLATLGSVSNIVFWREAGYFDAAGHYKPLLHTWSLAVEEQFYLVWPLTAVLLWKIGRQRALISVLAVAGVVSLVATEYWLPIDPSAAFYLAPFRVTELAIGALCVWLVRAATPARWVQEGIVAVGLAAIAYATLRFDSHTPFPGRSALIPCLGAAAVIYAGAGSRLGALLGNRAAVGVGLISYSLYLVHWPLYVFYRYTTLRPLTRSDKAILVVAAFALATLMYHFVERPVRLTRSGSRLRSGRGATVVFGSVALVLAIPAALAWRSDGWRWRVAPEVDNASGDYADFKAARARLIRDNECHMSMGFDSIAPTLPGCLTVKGDNANFLVIGDSHAADLWAALVQAYPRVTFLQATGAGCAPVASFHPRPQNDCGRLLRAVKNDVGLLQRVDGVILNGRWDSRLSEVRREVAEYRKRGIPVVVFGLTAEYDPPVRLLLHRYGKRDGFSMFAERFRVGSVTRLDQQMRDAMKRDSTAYVSRIDVYCGSGACPLFDTSGKLSIQDYGHLGVSASAYFANALAALYPDPFDFFDLNAPCAASRKALATSASAGGVNTTSAAREPCPRRPAALQ